MPHDANIRERYFKTWSIYERHAASFDAERSKVLYERKWLNRFQGLLPPKGHILDVGCGTGEPIAKYFIDNGYSVTGVDYAESIIELAKKRFPHAAWHVADMCQLDLATTFDGIIGWHSFFHLTPDQQRSTLKRFAAHLKPKGALLLTVGAKEGEVVGHVCGEEVYHSSLSPREYRKILNNLGLEIVDFVFEDPECDSATVLLAQDRGRV